MKRTTIVLGLALVLVLGVASTAYGANPPGTYKLTVCTYFDANSNAWWQTGEPGLPGTWVELEDASGNSLGIVETGACGVGYAYVPIGTTVIGYAYAVDAVEWDKLAPPGSLAYRTEATPMKSKADWYKAKVVMNGNRCMVFGAGPEAYAPPACVTPCPPCYCVK